ncbi:hypothetical protein DEU56DRAFT_908923 [Suillus clintonianus]|uniref:uncharacterized protein n=1 Tax=Suillus clintonianus TaxID=1904413 RepID=UPI001B863320|nr:uncharacterized protein DEU56DRAFT_908923 [Suillus clintonianus]KAG2149223.1 hypothetical protein DEU56DRAFT_908923 [Suillus clintonianus]
MKPNSPQSAKSQLDLNPIGHPHLGFLPGTDTSSCTIAGSVLQFHGPAASWMQQPSPDFGIMDPDAFTAGLLGDPALGIVEVGDKSLWGAPSAPNAQVHLAPPPTQTTFHFPSPPSQSITHDPAGQPSSGLTQEFSGQSLAFTLRPVPYLPGQDHVLPPLPATKIIPPTPLKDGGSSPNHTLVNTTNAPPPTSTRDPSPMLVSGYYNSAATSCTRFPEENEPVTHHEEHVVTGRRSDDMNTALKASFGEIKHCFLKHSTSTTLSMNQLINLFLKSRGRAVNGTNYWNLYANYFKNHVQQELLESGSTRFGFEVAIVLCGKVINEDRSLGHSYNTPSAAGIPVNEGEVPPPEWPHPGAQRMFIDGHTNYDDLPCLKPSTATAKVKKSVKAPKSPSPSSESELDDNEPAETSPNMHLKGAPPPPPLHPFKVVAKLIATTSEVIELTSVDDNLSEEPGTEYEEVEHGKKRKIKSANTLCASKKIAPSTKKTNTSKAGKKGVLGKNAESKSKSKVLSMTSPTKGGPLSPLTVESSSDGLPSPEHGQAMHLRDGLLVVSLVPTLLMGMRTSLPTLATTMALVMALSMTLATLSKMMILAFVMTLKAVVSLHATFSFINNPPHHPFHDPQGGHQPPHDP